VKRAKEVRNEFLEVGTRDKKPLKKRRKEASIDEG
jgi:hypothetical protein